MRLAPKDIPEYRARMLKKQRGLCALCKEPCSPEQATLDHDHRTGHIRGVLHRQCNSVEGRVLNWLNRAGRLTPPALARALLRYWARDYSKNPIHPNHGKPKKRRRRRKRRA